MHIHSSRLDLVYVRGKRGNKVPLLLTSEVRKSIEALISTRESIGVVKKNPFIFAAPTRGSLNHLRGHDCLSAVLANCEGLKCKEAIKSTKLRKYVATVSQIVDLKEGELDWLAKHMGHNLKVHREYYRLQEHTLELAKVSKLLMAVDEGNAGKWAGKKLDEIQLDGEYKVKLLSTRFLLSDEASSSEFHF